MDPFELLWAVLYASDYLLYVAVFGIAVSFFAISVGQFAVVMVGEMELDRTARMQMNELEDDLKAVFAEGSVAEPLVQKAV